MKQIEILPDLPYKGMFDVNGTTVIIEFKITAENKDFTCNLLGFDEHDKRYIGTGKINEERQLSEIKFIKN